jgi:hypothetical protein
VTHDPERSARSNSSAQRPRIAVAVAGAAFGVLLTATAGCAANPAGDDLTARQAQVAEAGSQVMPFDLDRPPMSSPNCPGEYMKIVRMATIAWAAAGSPTPRR